MGFCVAGNQIANFFSILFLTSRFPPPIFQEYERKKNILKKSHDLLHHRAVHIHAAPFILQAATPAEDVHIIFTMLKCTGIFVSSYGSVVGVVLKEDLFRANTNIKGGQDEYAALYGSSRKSRKKASNCSSSSNMFTSFLKAEINAPPQASNGVEGAGLSGVV